MSIKAVLFDLDGTLVNSLEDLTDAINFMLADFSKNTLSTAEIVRLVGKGARNLVRRALESDAPADIERGLSLFVAFNTAHIADKSRLYPGVRELLETLAANGLRLAAISNKQEALSRLILESLGIAGYFEVICGGDTFPEMKPSPLPLLKVVDGFGLTPGQTIMIGDSINDIQAGKRAGIATIGCTWGYGGLGELAEADHLANSCNEVAEILKQLEP